MADKYLIARLRPRDKDIAQELDRRQWSTGQMSDFVRESVRRNLFGSSAMAVTMPIDPVFGELQQVEAELPDDPSLLIDGLLNI